MSDQDQPVTPPPAPVAAFGRWWEERFTPWRHHWFGKPDFDPQKLEASRR